MKLLLRYANRYRRFILFCVVGASSAAISILVFNFCVYLGAHYLLANSVAFILSIINGFYWNKNHVFKNDSNKTIIRFFTLYLSTFLLGQALLFIFVEQCNIIEAISQLIVIGINTFINYIMCKLLVFK